MNDPIPVSAVEDDPVNLAAEQRRYNEAQSLILEMNEVMLGLVHGMELQIGTP